MISRRERRQVLRIERNRALQTARLKAAGELLCDECGDLIEPDEDSLSVSLDGPYLPPEVRHAECWLSDVGP